jgi:nicotinamide mononucleotide adenylyltransferase
MYFVKNEKFEITDEAKEKVKEVIKNMVANKDKHFGNAREMRKLFKHIKANLDVRVSKLIDQKDLSEIEKMARIIEAEDVSAFS